MNRRFCLLLCVLILILGSTEICSIFARAAATAKIAFTSTRDGDSEVYVVNPDGNQQMNLTQHPVPKGKGFDGKIAKVLARSTSTLIIYNNMGNHQTKIERKALQA